MIDRKQLTLEERTKTQYNEFKLLIAELTKKPHLRKIPAGDIRGYSEITTPLVFESYEHLLEEAMQTGTVKKVSTKPPDRKEWVRFKIETLEKEIIPDLSELAKEAGFIFIGFYSLRFNNLRVNNEIGFEQDNGNIKSVCLQIPGSQKERNLYNWHGSNDKNWMQINGIYVPKPI